MSFSSFFKKLKRKPSQQSTETDVTESPGVEKTGTDTPGAAEKVEETEEKKYFDYYQCANEVLSKLRAQPAADQFQLYLTTYVMISKLMEIRLCTDATAQAVLIDKCKSSSSAPKSTSHAPMSVSHAQSRPGCPAHCCRHRCQVWLQSGSDWP